MCFNAEVSFAAGAVLATTGVFTLRRAWGTRFALFAAMPLLFAVQQTFEGVLWTILPLAPYHRSNSYVAHGFLFFALGLWPFYIPLATWAMERDPRRRRLMALCTVPGFALGAYLLACTVVRPVYSCLTLQENIYYGVQYDTAFKPFMNAVYLLLVTVPLALSTVRGARAFGAAGAIAFALSAVFFRVAFASVWCFFAALLSLAIHRILVVNQRGAHAATPALSA